jgi:hypothetical protein
MFFGIFIFISKFLGYLKKFYTIFTKCLLILSISLKAIGLTSSIPTGFRSHYCSHKKFLKATGIIYRGPKAVGVNNCSSSSFQRLLATRQNGYSLRSEKLFCDGTSRCQENQQKLVNFKEAFQN